MKIHMKEKRKSIGLTQKQIAEKLGIARVTYTNIEIGNKDPSLKLALLIKNILRCTDDNIFRNF